MHYMLIGYKDHSNFQHLTKDHHIVNITATNTQTFIRQIHEFSSSSTISKKALILTNCHALSYATEQQLYKIIMDTQNIIIFISNTLMHPYITQLCKVYYHDQSIQDHPILRYIKTNAKANQEPMHDYIMQMNETDAQQALQAIGAFLEKCLLAKPQAHIALDHLLTYWHEIISNSTSQLITNIQGLKLYYLYLCKHFFK